MRYTKTHEWVEMEDEDTVTIGVSNRVIQDMGRIIFVELPEEGEEFEQDDHLASIESIDGEMISVYSPVSGEVMEINGILENSPELINKSPEGDGWLVKMHIISAKEIKGLMTLEEYEDYEEEDFLDEEEYEDEDEEEY
ncbi:glycine cleavage system protein GcvH [Candidatus Poribacteria bacterium]|nr:glycine cleavage system protein GcvH [Candidatus Poribacteria bacterium]